MGFMNAAFGVRLAPERLAVFFRAEDFFAEDFFAEDFFAPFFAEDFFADFFAPFLALFFAAILISWECEQVLALGETLYDAAQDTIPQSARNREFRDFPYEKRWCEGQKVGMSEEDFLDGVSSRTSEASVGIYRPGAWLASSA
jgi:hypothetical protein